MLVGLLGGVVASGLTPWLRGSIAESDSVWYSRRLQVWLATLGCLGVSALAKTWVQLATFVLLAVGLALLVTVDVAEERLPDKLTLPLYAILFGGLALDAYAGGSEWADATRAALASGGVLALFLALALLGPLYLGDVKLAGVLGGLLGWFGWANVLSGMFAGFLLHALIGIGLMISHKATRKTEFAFGPSLVAGAALSLALTPWLHW